MVLQIPTMAHASRDCSRVRSLLTTRASGMGGRRRMMEHKGLGMQIESPSRMQRLRGHWETIVPALAHAHVAPAVAWRREQVAAQDGEKVDWDWSGPASAAKGPVVVLFHGLEGSSRSHYAQALGWACERRGWLLAVHHFRGCAGTETQLPRAYHAGDWEEIAWVLREIKVRYPDRPRFAVGVSLGGNAMLLWAGREGEGAIDVVRGLVAISPPLDLAASGAALEEGINRWLYARHFLRSMRAKARRMADRHPGLFDAARASQARSLREFDDAFTAPLHGFGGVERYWSEASARPWLKHIRVPTLLLTALNDPLVPPAALPDAKTLSVAIEWRRTRQGGHVGFGQLDSGRGWRSWIRRISSAPLADAVVEWIATRGGNMPQCEGLRHG